MADRGKLSTPGFCNSLRSLHDKVIRDVLPHQPNNVLGILRPSSRIRSKARRWLAVASMIELQTKFTRSFLKLFLG